MTASTERSLTRNDLTRTDLAWAIAVGGIGVVVFAAILILVRDYAATLFLIFAGMLLGVALNAMSNGLGRFVQFPHPARLAIVCLVLASLVSGVVLYGGNTIAQQATARLARYYQEHHRDADATRVLLTGEQH